MSFISHTNRGDVVASYEAICFVLPHVCTESPAARILRTFGRSFRMSRRTLRFLALGDSLTEGYYNYGGDFHPYTIQLQHRFDTMNPAVVLQYFGMDSDTDVKFKVFNSGVSGETTEDMLPRLEYLLRSDQGYFRRILHQT